MKAKFFTTLEDVHALKGKKTHDIHLEIEEGYHCIDIKPEGYGDFASAKNCGVPIILEVYEGRLRLIVFPDINKDDATIIDMEGAREEARKKVKRIIESNSLPYFGEDGIVNIFDKATGKRVFVKQENLKDRTTDGGRMCGLFKFEITEE
jgi:hypothetical protein